MNSLPVHDLHRAGPYLFAVTGLALGGSDGVWRIDVSTPGAEWVRLFDLEGIARPRGVWSPWATSDTIYVCGKEGEEVLWKSTDGGAAWLPSGPESGGGLPIAGVGDGENLLLGAIGGTNTGLAYRSLDYGASWRCVLECPGGGGATRDIAFRPGEPSEVWAIVGTGFFSSLAYKSTDGGSTWVERWSSLLSATGVAVSPGGTVLIANELQIARSTNGGLTWMAGPIGGLHRVEFGPWSGDHVLAGGYQVQNVYLSEDDGVTWELLNDGLPPGPDPPGSAVWAIEADPVLPGVFYIGTEPYGVWRIELPGVVSVSEPENPTPVPLRVLSNPARGALRIALDAPQAEHLDVFDAAGRRVRTTHLRAGVRELTWDGRLESGGTAPPGTYFVRVPGAAARSFVWLGP